MALFVVLPARQVFHFGWFYLLLLVEVLVAQLAERMDGYSKGPGSIPAYVACWLHPCGKIWDKLNIIIITSMD